MQYESFFTSQMAPLPLPTYAQEVSWGAVGESVRTNKIYHPDIQGNQINMTNCV